MSPPPTPDPLLRVATALVFALAAAAYLALARAGFVWDDVPLVVDNTLTGQPGVWLGAFTTDLWQTAGGAEVHSGYYRPLVLWSFALDRALWGLSPAGHHLHSLAWHLGAGAALLALLRRVVSPWPALAGAALFLLHPVQSEAVAWIAARNDLMVAAFTFAAVAALLPKRPGPGRLALGGGLALAALLSKEQGLLVLPLLLALDLAQTGRPGPPLRYGAALLAAVAWLALRTLAGVGGAALPDAAHRALLLDRAHELAAHTLARLAWPWPLTVGHTLEYLRPEDVSAPLAVALALALAALAWRGRGLGVAGLAAAGVAFAPALLALAVRGQLGERYLYLPMGGLALTLAAALPAGRRAAAALGLAPLALVALHHRLPEWRDDLSLWSAAVEDAPSGYTWASLGHVLNQEDRGVEATALFHQALQDRPPYVEVCPQAILAPLKRGLLVEAERGADLVVAARCPEDNHLRGLLAITWAQRGRWQDVAAVVARADDRPDGRLPLARGALALRDGDLEAFSALRDAMPDPAAFEAQVRRLLAVSEPGTLEPGPPGSLQSTP